MRNPIDEVLIFKRGRKDGFDCGDQKNKERAPWLHDEVDEKGHVINYSDLLGELPENLPVMMPYEMNWARDRLGTGPCHWLVSGIGERI